MFWASIANGYRSPLVVVEGSFNAQRYRDIVAMHVVPLLRSKTSLIFQHDNATSHTAKNSAFFIE